MRIKRRGYQLIRGERNSTSRAVDRGRPKVSGRPDPFCQRPSIVFARVWILVAAGRSLGQMHAVARHNAESSLQVSMSQMPIC